ncbi:MAG: FHA domain-containing protein [Lachnospiraceae bacterium]|nr:FHA domain-containing protein [Lachnospiraceae bacterium]
MDDKELKLQYRKSMDHNYLVAELPDEDYQDYRLEMILENNVPGLLRASKRMNEGREQIYYEISSMQPLSRIFDHKEIKRSDAAAMLRGIIDVFKSIREYMLSEGALVLAPEYLFVDPENLKPCLLFIPWDCASMQERLLALTEYLMEHIDQNDAAAAMWTYRLYKAVKNENCVLGDLEKMLTEQPVSADSVEICSDDRIINRETSVMPRIREQTDIFINEEEEEDNERKQGLFTRIFGRSKDPQKKTEKKTAKKDREKDTVKVLNSRKPAREEHEDDQDIGIPDFSAAFSDMEPVNDSDGDYGKTVFIGQTDAPVENLLVEKSKGKQYRISNFPYTIGKVKNCVDLPINDSSVSRIHARIFMQNGHAYIQDCHSTNGTFINGVQLEAEEQVMLEKEDEIGIGRVRFSYM